MPYNPGNQDISGQILSQGYRDVGNSIGDGIKTYFQHKMMAGQAIAKFEGAAKADPEILKFLDGPGASPEASKAYKKLLKDGTVGVRDASVLAQFADSYLNEKTQQQKLQAIQQENMLRFLGQQANNPPVMDLAAVQQQFPTDRYDANMVPVPNQPGKVQVKGVSPRAPQNSEPKMVATPAGVNVYDREGKLLRVDPINQSAVPSGYRQTEEGKLEAIPGGPAEAETKKAEEGKRAKVLSESTRLSVMVNAIDEVLPKISAATAGPGALLSVVPGSPAYDLAAKLDTLKANIGFQQLADMRAASPTGGALGQVAVKELDFLQAALGNVSPWQSPTQLKENLQKIRTHLERWQKAVQGIDPDDEKAKEPAKEAAPPASSGALQIKSIKRIN